MYGGSGISASVTVYDTLAYNDQAKAGQGRMSFAHSQRPGRARVIEAAGQMINQLMEI